MTLQVSENDPGNTGSDNRCMEFKDKNRYF